MMTARYIMDVVIAQAGPPPPPPRPSTVTPGPGSQAPKANPSSTLIPFGGQNPLSPFLPSGAPDAFTLTIGGALIVLVALLAFAPKIAITRHLVSIRSTPSAASGAGWALYCAVVALGIVLVAAVVGNFWTNYVILGPAGAAVLILFLLFFVVYQRAKKTHR